ncbi:MAG: hypothetical protein ACOCZ5_02735 [bacterium]
MIKMLRDKDTYTRIVNKNYSYMQGGRCAECQKSISGYDTIRCSIEYEYEPEESSATIIEPFNLCYDCVEELEKQEQ